jgi:hypothetical protein
MDDAVHLGSWKKGLRIRGFEGWTYRFLANSAQMKMNHSVFHNHRQL